MRILVLCCFYAVRSTAAVDLDMILRSVCTHLGKVKDNTWKGHIGEYALTAGSKIIPVKITRFSISSEIEKLTSFS